MCKTKEHVACIRKWLEFIGDGIGKQRITPRGCDIRHYIKIL